MKRFDIFKITFLIMSAATFIILVIYGLFKLRDADLLNKATIIPMLLKSLGTAVITGAILGLGNMQTNNQNWASHPTKKVAIITFTIWFLGLIAVIIEASHGFQTDPFIEINLLTLYAAFIASFTYLRIGKNYLKNDKDKSANFKKIILKLFDTITNPLFITTLCVLSSYLLRHEMRIMGKMLLALALMVIVLWLNNMIDKKIEKRINQI